MNKSTDIFRSPEPGTMLAPITAIDPTLRDDRLDVRSLLVTLRRNLKVFTAVLLVVLAATVVVTMNQRVRYAATSQIVIDLASAQIAPRQDTQGQSAVQSPSDQVDTEVKVLMSRDVAERVVDVLNLIANPEFNPMLAPPSTGILARLKASAGLSRPRKQISASAIRRAIVDELLSGLQITRSGDSYAVDVTATASSAEGAHAIANEFARQYIRSRVRSKVDDNQTATSFLSGKLDELRRQAHSDMQQVQQYRIAHNLLSTSGASLTEQEISTYNQAVATARAEASEDQARLNTARTQLSSGSNGDDVGEALGSTVVSQLRTRQAEVSGRLAVLRARYTPAHPEVIRAQSELADIDSQIQAEITRVISNLEAKARVSQERLDSLSGSLSSAKGTLAQNNKAMTDLDDLERRANASQEVYESYLGRYKQISTEGGIEQPGAHLISEAELPLSPVSPNIKLNLILGGVLGLGCATAAAFLVESLFSGLTSGQDVEERLGVRYLGGIPTFARSGAASKLAAGTSHIAQNPRSAFTEAFRTLRAGLFNRMNGDPRVVMITSALPKEGKTTTAICLARLLAQTGEKVVLVDSDRRLARVSRELAGSHATGLLEVLDGSATLDDTLVCDRVTELMILPLSENTDPRDDLFRGEAMIRLLDELRERFRYIIIDTAPVLAIAEGRTLAAAADAVVMVARWRHTPHHAIRAALRLFAASGIQVTGLALTRINLAQQRRFAHGDAASYYKRYQAYYS